MKTAHARVERNFDVVITPTINSSGTILLGGKVEERTSIPGSDESKKFILFSEVTDMRR